MEELKKKDLFFVGLMLFCMFFGAGNLIFPPFLGEMAGTNMWMAFGGFIISAVGLPVLSVIVVSKSDGLYNLASCVHPLFAIAFTILIYLSIGPFLGIPRTGSISYEMAVVPFLAHGFANSKLPLFIFTFLYFAAAFCLSLTPSKLVDRLGKVLTPIFLVLIAVVFIASVFKPMGGLGTPKGDYANFPFFKGFSEGYMTMDAIAGLNFGIVISTTLKSMGVKEKKSIVGYSSKAGLIVGGLLIVIYAMLTLIGGSSRTICMNVQSGADVLTNVFFFLFGKNGAILLGIIFTLACFSTAVGLITSCSEYFASLSTKVSYKKWVFIISFVSMVFANEGLTQILAISVPILNAIYPMAIVLMLLFIFKKLFNGSRKVYISSMIFVSVFSIVDSINQSVLKIKYINSLFNYIPLYSKGLGWIIPAILGAGIGYILSAVDKGENVLMDEA